MNESKHESPDLKFLNLLKQSIAAREANPQQFIDKILSQVKIWYDEKNNYRRYELALINLQILIGVLKLENNLFSAAQKEELVTIANELLPVIDKKSEDYNIRDYLQVIVAELRQQLKGNLSRESELKISKLEDELPHSRTGKNRYSKKNEGNWNRDNIYDTWITSQRGIIDSFPKDNLLKTKPKFSGKVIGEACYRFFDLVMGYLIPLMRHKKQHNLEVLYAFVNHLISPLYSQNKDLISCIFRFFLICLPDIDPSINSSFKETLKSQNAYQNWLTQQLGLNQEPNLVKVVFTLKFISNFIQAGKSEFTLLLLSFTHAINEYIVNWYSNISASRANHSFIMKDFETHLENSRIVFTTPIEKKEIKVGKWQSLLAQQPAELSKVSHVKEQKESTEIVLTLLNSVLQNCQNLLGDAPCEIALLVLGSTSHQNRLPYSDLEFALLCDPYPENDTAVLNEKEQQIVAYVYTLASLLDLSIVCFGETFSEKSNQGGGFRIDTSTHFIEHPNEREEKEKFIGTPEQLVSNLILKLVAKEIETEENEIKNENTQKNCLLIGNASFYSLLEPELVNTVKRNLDHPVKHKTGEILFERYKTSVRQFLDETLPHAIKNKLTREFISSPMSITDIAPPLNYRKAIALYVLLEILQKSEEAIQKILNGSLVEIDIKQIYGKPIIYFGLALNSLENLGCCHPVDAILKASEDQYKLLTPGFAHFLQRCFEWILSVRIQLHLDAKAQEECIKIVNEDKKLEIHNKEALGNSDREKNTITFDDISQGYFNAIIQFVIKSLRECLENYLKGHTLNSEFPFDPCYLLLNQLKAQNEKPNPEFQLESFLTRLAKQASLQVQTAEEHLWFYRQIPTVFRNKYAICLISHLGDQPFERVIKERLVHYPEDGLRRSSKRNKSVITWQRLIKTQLTEEITKENFHKKLSELHTDGRAYLEWWDDQGRLQRGVLISEIQNQLFHSNGALREELRNVKEARRLVIGLRLKDPQKETNKNDESKHQENTEEAPIAFCKFFPEKSGIQIQIAELSHQISGYGLECVMAKLSYPCHAQSQNPKIDAWISYPVLISKSAGKTLAHMAEKDKAANRTPLTDLVNSIDPYSFTLKFLESVIAGYEDERPHNLCPQSVLNTSANPSQRFVSIDSDHAYQDALRAEGWFKKEMVLNIKNFLYCMNNMLQPLDKQAVEEFLQLDAYKILQIIIQKACEYDKRYIDEGLFKHDEVECYSQGLGINQKRTDRCSIAAEFAPGIIAKLYLKIRSLEVLSRGYLKPIAKENLVVSLSTKNKNLPTPLQVLEQLEQDLVPYYEIILNMPFKERMNLLFDHQIKRSVVEKGLQKIPDKKSSQSFKQPSVQEVAFALSRPSAMMHDISLQDLGSKHRAWHEELNKIHSYYGDYESIEKYRKIIEESKEEKDLKPFFELSKEPYTTILIEKIINHIDFSKIEVGLQILILGTLTGHSFSKLNLVGCRALGDPLLKSILKKSTHLRVLNLRGCINLTEDILKFVADYCPQLEKLDLRNLIGWKVIRSEKIFRTIVFKNLKYLRLDYCSQLTDAQFITPKLEILTAIGCSSLLNLPAWIKTVGQKEDVVNSDVIDRNISLVKIPAEARVRIVLVSDNGNSISGKSTMLARYLKNEYSPSFTTTTGSDFGTKNMKINDVLVRLEILDISAYARSGFATVYFKGSEVFLYCHDIDKNLDPSQSNFKEMIQYAESISPAPLLFLIGTKSDLVSEDYTSWLYLKSISQADYSDTDYYLFDKAEPLTNSKLFYVRTGLKIEQVPISDMQTFERMRQEIMGDAQSKELTKKEVTDLIPLSDRYAPRARKLNGHVVAKEYGFAGYLECSAKTGEGINEAFEIPAQKALVLLQSNYYHPQPKGKEISISLDEVEKPLVKLAPVSVQTPSVQSITVLPKLAVQVFSEYTIKILLLHDGTQSSMNLLSRFLITKFSPAYEKIVSINFSIKIMYVHGSTFRLEIFDVPNTQDFTIIPKLHFPHIDIILCCSSSILNDEVTQSNFNAVLGEKIPKFFIIMDSSKTKMVDFHEADRLRRKYNFVETMQCSVETGEGVQDVFETVIRFFKKILSVRSIGDSGAFPIKIVLVSDSTGLGGGTSNLLDKYVEGAYYDELGPTSIDFKIKRVEIGNKKFNLCIYDISVENWRYLNLRHIHDANTHVILYCNSVVEELDPKGNKFQIILEVKKKIPVLLVATKCDLLNRYHRQAWANEGEITAKKYGFVGYMECSAKTGQGVDAVFTEAARIGHMDIMAAYSFATSANITPFSLQLGTGLKTKNISSKLSHASNTSFFPPAQNEDKKSDTQGRIPYQSHATSLVSTGTNAMLQAQKLNNVMEHQQTTPFAFSWEATFAHLRANDQLKLLFESQIVLMLEQNQQNAKEVTIQLHKSEKTLIAQLKLLGNQLEELCPGLKEKDFRQDVLTLKFKNSSDADDFIEFIQSASALHDKNSRISLRVSSRTSSSVSVSNRQNLNVPSGAASVSSSSVLTSQASVFKFPSKSSLSTSSSTSPATQSASAMTGAPSS